MHGEVEPVEDALVVDLDDEVLDLKHSVVSVSPHPGRQRASEIGSAGLAIHAGASASRAACGLSEGLRRDLPDRAFERDRDQLLRLDGELHRQLLQHVLDEAVDDERHRLLRRRGRAAWQ